MAKNSMKLFLVNSQEAFNLDSIEHISDPGDRVIVTLKTGKVFNVSFRDKERFYKAIGVKQLPNGCMDDSK